MMSSGEILRSAGAFLTAGLCEIGGGYLVWLWLREGRPGWFGLLGGITLFLYGIVATLQPVHFGRAYAAYGGIFIALSLLWGWRVDKVTPDRYDLCGAALVVLGSLVIMYWPRPLP